jgi:predicted RNA-binding Zn-ribbon protein involved in translation (DUF1610 family)
MILPDITGFSLRGFSPIFPPEVTTSLLPGPTLVLGGNALGKTTLVQGVIYGLTGGTPPDEEKRFRWSNEYFRGRLDDKASRTATVEVEVRFGVTNVRVTRGVASRSLQEVVVDGELLEEPDDAFGYVLREIGGYETREQFAFVVTRLLYLPETRRLLAWDLDAQLRLLPVLGIADTFGERFRGRRAELKELDSKQRHLQVEINKIVDYFDRPAEVDSTDIEPRPGTEIVAVDEALNKFQRAVDFRATAEAQLTAAAESLSAASIEVQLLRSQIEHLEAALVTRDLAATETSAQLPINKLIELGLCPACGTRQLELQAAARRHADNHECVICGSEHAVGEDSELSTLRSQLSERLRAEKAVADRYRQAVNLVQSRHHAEQEAQHTLDDLALRIPAPTSFDPMLEATDLPERLVIRQREEATLRLRIQNLATALDREYADFADQAAGPLDVLKERYSSYATAFLGVPCSLVEVPAKDKHLNLSLFVPKFQGHVRSTEQSCSEAQRFFLDIAFRMAMMEVATEATATQTSFVCETPESALDISYIDNVITMFDRFEQNGHRFLLTTNVQRGGVAEGLIGGTPIAERSQRVINLLSIGRLSDVQRNSKALASVASKIMKAER